MGWLFTYNYATSHMFVPKIIIAILTVLGVCIVVSRLRRRAKSGSRGGFFAPGCDKLKFWGTLILLVLYIAALETLHFLPASLIFIFLFNVLFCGTLKLKSLAVSALSTCVFVCSVYYIFGEVFNITLP